MDNESNKVVSEPKRAMSTIIHNEVELIEQQGVQGSFRAGAHAQGKTFSTATDPNSSTRQIRSQKGGYRQEEKVRETTAEYLDYSDEELDEDDTDDDDDDDEDDDDEDDDDERFDRKREVRRYGYSPTTMFFFELDDPIRTFCVLLANDGRFKK